jgi:hypothetical protein
MQVGTFGFREVSDHSPNYDVDGLEIHTRHLIIEKHLIGAVHPKLG